MNEVVEAPPVAACVQQLPTGQVAVPAAASAGTAAVQAPTREPSVIEAAIKAGASAAELREILALQRDLDNHKLALMREERAMREEDRKLRAKLAFDDAMSKLRGFNVIIPKTKEVVQKSRSGGEGPRFWQSEYDMVCSLLSPALAACGLGFRHDMKFGQREWKADGSNPQIPAGTDILLPWVTVTCYLTHRDGHTETLTLDGPADTSGSKTPLQEMQSTGSYLKRQSILAITGTATGGEDNENRLTPASRRQGTDKAQDADNTLFDTGHAEAKKGMQALTAWWSTLTPREQKDMGPEFLQMRKAARRVDEESARQHGASA